MKTSLVLFSMLFAAICFSQENRIVFDENKSQEILYGECNRDAFTKDGFEQWFDAEYESYMVMEHHFETQYPKQFDSIYVFLATWCGDTKRELPRFCKVMDHPYFEGTPIKYFAFDGKKQNDIIDSEEYYLQFVPTFIFYSNGLELCRIVEAPRDSFEEDIVDLLIRLQD